MNLGKLIILFIAHIPYFVMFYPYLSEKTIVLLLSPWGVWIAEESNCRKWICYIIPPFLSLLLALIL